MPISVDDKYIITLVFVETVHFGYDLRSREFVHGTKTGEKSWYRTKTRYKAKLCQSNYLILQSK